jgi:hypothetical protein
MREKEVYGTHGRKKIAYMFLTEKSEGRNPL